MRDNVDMDKKFWNQTIMFIVITVIFMIIATIITHFLMKDTVEDGAYIEVMIRYIYNKI